MLLLASLSSEDRRFFGPTHEAVSNEKIVYSLSAFGLLNEYDKKEQYTLVPEYLRLCIEQRMDYTPVSLHVCAFILQENDLTRVMAANFTVVVLDDAVFIVSSKQLQTARLDFHHPRSDLFCSVLRLGKQIYQIRYFFALSDRQPRGREAAGRGGRGGHHSATTRGGGLNPDSTSFKHRSALCFGMRRPTRPSLPSQLLPDCPLEGAGAGESS